MSRQEHKLIHLLQTEWADKKVVVFALPGAFTPSCSASHLPGFIEKLPELKAKGVDIVACVSFNDAFVMSGWGKANGIKDDSIVSIFSQLFLHLKHPEKHEAETLQLILTAPPQLFLCDPEAALSKKFGWTIGERTSRYALVIDHGKITYAAVEPSPNYNVTVSSAESVLAAL